jgi:Zn-dependent peptidase ImmA (M78 family)
MLENAVELQHALLPDLPVEVDARARTPEEAARASRTFFGVAQCPIRHVIRLAERAGVVVVFNAPGVAAIDAYSLQAATRPMIILNSTKDDYYRQRFDVAHELGHLVMRHDAEPGGKVAEEQANRFASEFLMPAEEIAPCFPGSTAGKAWPRLAEQKEHCGVRLAALLYRSRARGLMGEVSYRKAMRRMSQDGWSGAEPGRISSLKMPSMLERAREVPDEAGIDDETFLSGSGLPVGLYEIAASRVPRSHRPD